MEKKMESVMMGVTGTTTRILSSFPANRRSDGCSQGFNMCCLSLWGRSYADPVISIHYRSGLRLMACVL